MRKTLLLLLLLSVAAPAVAAGVDVQTLRLPNGIRVALAPAIPGETIAIHVTFDAGSKLDPKHREGTALLASRVFASRLAGFSDDVNAERSSFTASASSQTLGAALRQLRDALGNRTVPRTAIDPASGSEAEGILLRLVYGDRPHGHAPTMISSRAQHRDVERFFQRNYGTSSVVVAFAGTLDRDAIAQIETILGSIPTSGAARRCDSYSVRLRRQRSREIQLPVAQTEIHWGYPTAPATAADWYALNILADIIGQGPASRLQRRLVEGGLAKNFGEGETEWPCGPSIFRMRARLMPDVQPSTVLTAVDEEFDRLRRELVTDAELATARDQERAWMDEQLSTPAGVASAIGRSLLFYGEAARINTDVSRMVAVTAEDVRRVAQRYLPEANRAVVVVRPVE